MTVYYPAIVEPALDGYCVFFPDLPGCTSAGDSLQHAARNAEEALQMYLELSLERGFAVAPPSELDAITVDPDVVEAARVLVPFEPPERPVTVDVTLPEDLLRAFDARAARLGFTRSGLLAFAAREELRRDQDAA